MKKEIKALKYKNGVVFWSIKLSCVVILTSSLMTGIQRDASLITNVYRKPMHTGRYIHFKSDHPQHVKRGVVYNIVNRARVLCQEHKDFSSKIKTIKQDLMLNGYLQHFIDSVIKSRRNKHPSTDRIPHTTVINPYVRGISEKFWCIENHFNIRTIFKTECTLQGSLLTNRPRRDVLKTRLCMVSHVIVVYW
jgi:uncharacterized protein (UPF0335 family)